MKQTERQKENYTANSEGVASWWFEAKNNSEGKRLTIINPKLHILLKKSKDNLYNLC